MKCSVLKLKSAILGINEVLRYAQSQRAEVSILSRSLSYDLCEKIWNEVSDSTLAGQLEDAVEAGSNVRILLANELNAEVLSARIVRLADRYDTNQFDVLAIGKSPLIDKFPNFTLVNNGRRWYDYIEYKPLEIEDTERLTANDNLNGKILLDSPSARHYGAALKSRFDIIFKKAKKSAKTNKAPPFMALSIPTFN